MRILKKDPNKVKIKTETNNYIEDFDFELNWKNEINLKMDNILNDYNLVEALAAEIEEPKQTYEEQSIYELLTDYTDIIYNDMKELAKTNII